MLYTKSHYPFRGCSCVTARNGSHLSSLQARGQNAGQLLLLLVIDTTCLWSDLVIARNRVE
jgi:hypothetical protein